MERHYLGIDQSLTGTGLAIVNANGIVRASVCLSVAGKLSGAARLGQIGKEFKAFVKFADVQHGCIEGYSVKSTNRPFDLGEVSGVLRAAYFELFERELTVVPPTSLKKFATGISGAEKDLMISSVNQKWGTTTDNDNIADAIALAQMARAENLNQYNTRSEREAVSALTRKKPVRLRHRHNPDNV